MCQAIADMSVDQISRIFGSEGNEAAFWDHFLRVIATRDSQIHTIFEDDVILQVLIYLSRLTRSKPADVGPITLEDAQRAFEMTVGERPVEEASVMLQRLPGLGRVGAESNDTRFIDQAILDSLRARDVINICLSEPKALENVFSERWTNPIGDLGQRVVSLSDDVSADDMLRVARQASSAKNKVLAADLVGSLTRGVGPSRDFGGLELSDCTFSIFDMTERDLSNLRIRDSTIFELRLGEEEVRGVSILDCLAGRVYGVTSASALPSWTNGLEVDNFDSAANVAEIRKMGLSIGHQVFLTIIRKSFFQSGSGRKEEALMRGFGSLPRPGLANDVLNLLLREDILRRFKGKDGWVYAPNREHTARMIQIRDKLKTNNDSLGDRVGKLN